VTNDDHNLAKKMATLRDYFALDFSKYMASRQEHSAKNSPDGESISYPVRTHEDLDANAKFISILVPAGLHPIALAKHYVDNPQDALKVGTGAAVYMSFGGLPSQMNNQMLVFTGRLFVYAEQIVPDAEIEQFRAYCLEKTIHLVWYDTRYADERSKVEQPKAFICHDSRDKQTVAEPIAVGLQRLLCPVWYDEFSLGIGDSLRESIEKGIKEAHRCIIICSPQFFSNDGWTKAEFDSIYTKEIIEKKRVILPIWHNVSKQQVYDYSPRLADRVAISTGIKMDEIVRRLHAKLTAVETNAAQ
jgi:hypothetical protein